MAIAGNDAGNVVEAEEVVGIKVALLYFLDSSCLVCSIARFASFITGVNIEIKQQMKRVIMDRII